MAYQYNVAKIVVAAALAPTAAIELTHFGSDSPSSDSPSADGNGCTCLNWKRLYKEKKKNLACGDGLEYYFKAGPSAKLPRWLIDSIHGERECRTLLERLDDNVCMNVEETAKDDWSGEQWCWVSEKCPSRPVPGHFDSHGVWAFEDATPIAGVKPKLCGHGEEGRGGDSLLRDKTPIELNEWAKKKDLSIRMAPRRAYPVIKEPSWEIAKMFFGQGSTPFQEVAYGFREPDQASDARMVEVAQSFNQTVDNFRQHLKNKKAEFTAIMDHIKKLGKPALIDSTSGEPPYAVVYGEKAYVIEETPEARTKANSPFTWARMKCIYKCDADDLH